MDVYVYIHGERERLVLRHIVSQDYGDLQVHYLQDRPAGWRPRKEPVLQSEPEAIC